VATASSLANTGRDNAFDNIPTATTDSILVAAVPLRKIRVRSVVLTQGTAAGGITFNSKPAGAGVAIAPAFTPAASAVMVIPDADKGGWFETLAGEGLSVTTGVTTSAVAVLVTFDLIVP
jgi:hypothetical protein